MEYIHENYFLIDVPRAGLSQTIIAQDQVVRARLRDVTVHQACVLVRGIVITLRHSSKSVYPDERLKKTRSLTVFTRCYFGTLDTSRLLLERVAFTSEREKGILNRFDSLLRILSRLSVKSRYVLTTIYNLSPRLSRE